LFELISQYSLLNSVPISIHAAESVEEHNLLANGVGFFTDIYEKFNFEWQSPGCSPIQYLERLGVLLVRPLLVHCVTVSPSDIQRIQNNGAKIAHCPKSNAKFGHGYAPFEDFLDQGIAVGLGTDSVASNNVCDLIEESRFAALAARNRAGTNRFLSAEEVLRAATLSGAEAMGLDGSIGSLEPGKQADIAVISLGQAAQKPIANVNSAIVFCSNARDVVLTIVAGKEVYRLPN
jgi:5-methylthioadenosine/S-adenosylhomocysteine deaminase